MTQDPIVIVSAVRTAMGGLLGCFKDITATELGSAAIKAAVERAHIKPEAIESALMGCVLPAGLGQAPARQAVLGAGLPLSVGCITVNKMCGSGMAAVMLAHDALLANSYSVMLAGGMESMTGAPYLIPKARAGYRFGHGQIYDHMLLDGLEDAYEKGQAMGVFAERCAEHYHFTREQQDEFAITSLKRAQKATEDGTFAAEITPFVIKNTKGDLVIDKDENPARAQLDKIPHLKPVFKANGTVTAANSSSISDGAAALILMRRSEAVKRGLNPLATIVGHSTHAQAPDSFTTAPIGAIQKLLDKISWKKDQVDLFEINEAFAVVAMAAIKELSLSPKKVNIHGGACALGHPIGASGARIIVTLLNALQKYNLKRGIASLCIGGGEATAIAIERE